MSSSRGGLEVEQWHAYYLVPMDPLCYVRLECVVPISQREEVSRDAVHE